MKIVRGAHNSQKPEKNMTEQDTKMMIIKEFSKYATNNDDYLDKEELTKFFQEIIDRK